MFNNIDSWLFTMVYSITANRAEADDIIQETWLKVLDNPANFIAAKGDFKNYIFTVAKNLALTRIRKINRHNEILKELKIDNTNLEINEDIVELNKLLMEAIKGIKNKNYQDVILLYYFAGFKANEIAEILETEEYSILNWLKRGRKMLEKKLKSHPEFDLIYDSIIKVIYTFLITLEILNG